MSQPRMCQAPGCGDLACVRITIKNGHPAGRDVEVVFCFRHGQKAQENRAEIERRCAQHTRRAPCHHCAAPATRQYAFGEMWVNACERHAREMIEKLTILRGGTPPPSRALMEVFREVPQVRIEER